MIEARTLRFQALALAIVIAGWPTLEACADVRVNVNLGPPPVVVAQPPAVVMVPGSQVYYVPDVDYDVFFYNGHWWSPRGEVWYRARDYNGPWRVVSGRLVPPPVYRIPPDYRRMYYRERRVPYGEWRRHWHEHDRGWRDEHWRDDRWDRRDHRWR